MADFSRVQDVTEIETLIASSHDKPIVFFKHSLTCPISSAGFRQYQSFLADSASDVDARYTLIEIQNARPVSAEVTLRTGVRHESPQALVMRNGKVTWHAR